MFKTLASHTSGPLEGIHLYYYEVQGLLIAVASLCMVVYAFCHMVKKRRVNNGAS